MLSVEDLATLEELLPEGYEAAEPLPFTPPSALDESGANWVLQQIGNLQAERERVGAQAQAIMDELRKREDRLRFLFEAGLARFTRQRLAEQKGKGKTVKLLQGSLSFRAVPGGPRVVDQEQAQLHAENIEECWRTERRFLTTEYLRLMQETGELLPGIEVVEPQERFYIKFPKSAQGGSG